jgi:hypothetical protein
VGAPRNWQASRKAKVEVNFKELISRKSLKTVRRKPEAMQWRTSDKELSETANKAKQRGRPPRSDEAFTQPKK